MITLYLKPKVFNDKNRKEKIISEIKIITNYLLIFSSDKNIEFIKTSEFYVMFFDIVLLLFYSYLPSIRLEILPIMKAFTIFKECKELLYKNLKSYQESLIIKYNKSLESKNTNTISKLDDNDSRYKNTNDNNNHSTSIASISTNFNSSNNNSIMTNTNANIPTNISSSQNNNSTLDKVLHLYKNLSTTKIDSSLFFFRTLQVLKLRILETYEQLKQLLINYQSKIREYKSDPSYQQETKDNKSKNIKEESISSNIELENMKSEYFSILNQYGLLISIFTNLFIADNFEEKLKILVNEGFIEKLKEMTEYFQNTAVFHKEIEIKTSPYNHLKYYINQLYLLLFMIFPDAKIEFIGEKTFSYYKDENRKLIVLMRLLDLLKANKSNTDFTAKVIFCITRFLSTNIIYRCYHDTIINIVNELLVFLKKKTNNNVNNVNHSIDTSSLKYEDMKFLNSQDNQFYGVILIEIYRLIYSLHLNANNLALFLPINSVKIYKDVSGNNVPLVKYKDENLKHYSIKRSIRHNKTDLEIFDEDSSIFFENSNKNKDEDYLIRSKFNNYDEEDKTISFPYLMNEKNNKNTQTKVINVGSTSKIKQASLLNSNKKTKTEYPSNTESNHICNKEFYREFIKEFQRKHPYNKFHNELIIFPPYKKITLYKNIKGCIFHAEHSIKLSRSLNLGNSFTILVRIFNPCPDTGRFHTLLQSNQEVGGLIVIDKHRSSLGCFTEDGKWLDSQIDLCHHTITYRWIHIALSYQEIEGNSKLSFYLNGKITSQYLDEKNVLPKTVKFIGNTSDYSEPFGIWCDLKIYKSLLDDQDINDDCRDKYYNESFSTELNFNIYSLLAISLKGKILNSSEESDENRLYFTKLLNLLLVNYNENYMFSDYDSFLKIINYSNTNNIQLKEEVLKYVMTLA